MHAMRRRRLISVRKNNYVIICLILIFFTGLYFFLDKEPYVSTQKLLRFNYAVKNDSGKPINDYQFTAVIPMEIKGIQTIKSIKSSHEYQLVNNSGRQSVYFLIENFSPFSTKIIDLTLALDLTDKPDTESGNINDYLQSQQYIETEASEIKDLAFQLKGKTSTETARNIYDWLVNNITEANYTADSKGAIYLIKNKKGDCTEFMYGFVALARANGIPARGISGFWVPNQSTLINAADYHDWAEFYDGKKWVLVDVINRKFGNSAGDYIALNIVDENQFQRFYSNSSQIHLMTN
ncbi:transglutaminase domain-containing protein [Cellvibrio japonicus]|nr:transglutaminase domain-containing protein [Cellvibrio japonicus]QEI14352.1 transglutaminase domain-containing protein [Cellvibrio japonicus]QEI17930.1 transglutaminase domain-containing protein [Cellvibrio japonicus]